jgi:hypothetical protein
MKKITELTEHTTLAEDDVLAIVDSIGTPTTKKVKVGNLFVGSNTGVGGNQFVKDLIASSANGGFTGNVPDAIMVNYNDFYGKFELHWLNPNDTQIDTGWELIYRMYISGESDFRINFKLDADGTPVDGGVLTADNSLDHDRNLRWFIDNGRAIYFGGSQPAPVVSNGKAGPIMASLNKVDNFYTTLPDAIVATTVNGFEAVLRLKFANNIANRTNGENFWYETRVNTASGADADYLIIFKDDEDGTFMGHSNQTDQMAADGSMDQNLRWFIDNGRALYY